MALAMRRQQCSSHGAAMNWNPMGSFPAERPAGMDTQGRPQRLPKKMKRKSSMTSVVLLSPVPLAAAGIGGGSVASVGVTRPVSLCSRKSRSRKDTAQPRTQQPARNSPADMLPPNANCTRVEGSKLPGLSKNRRSFDRVRSTEMPDPWARAMSSRCGISTGTTCAPRCCKKDSTSFERLRTSGWQSSNQGPKTPRRTSLRSSQRPKPAQCGGGSGAAPWRRW
mmetsp:Transcript_4097/g.10865  ORF Transcript_4097/g.10865 Transcript_4097/m.10865 type:complete len:223 (-) Transcript_4097:245-913(-)